MATKKQKREEALARREQFLKEERERGLEALRQSREAEARDLLDGKKQIDPLNDRHREILARHGIHE